MIDDRAYDDRIVEPDAVRLDCVLEHPILRDTASRTTGASCRAGLTIVEIAIAMTVMITILLGFSQALVSSMVASKVNREVALATDSARQLIETLQGADFTTVYAANNATQLDDPPGIATLTGGFAVRGLDPTAGDPDGLCGRIIFPEVPVGGGMQLRENIQHFALDMPRDLNGDGVTDALDHAADYKILPVIVRVEWRGSAGPAHVEFKTILSNF